MASSIQLLRSTIAQERPFAGNLLEGQPAVNLNSTEPGLFFKAADGSLVKFGPAAITSDGSPPNSSPQGSAGNTVGELWLDKSTDPAVLKVYDGTDWIDAGSGSGGGGAGSFVRWIYTAIGGETSLSGSSGGVLLSYTPGLEEVFVNGVLITRGTDYSATNGTSITNLAPLTAGDVITVTSMNPLEVVQLPGQVTLLRWTVLAAAGQTVLSGVDSSSQQLTYTAGFEEVYVNGAFLRRGFDYTATNGTSITLSSPLALDDEISVLAWTPFQIGEQTSAIDGALLINDSVGNNKLKAGIDGAKLLDNSIPSSKLIDITASSVSYTQPGSLISTTVKDKLDYATVNVRDYGVTPGANRTAEMQAAIDATPVGGTLMFYPGEFGCDPRIVVNKSMTIDFAGATIVGNFLNSGVPPSHDIIRITSSLDLSSAIEFEQNPIPAGTNTFNTAPPGDATVGDWVWLQLGSDIYDPNEEDYGVLCKIIDVTPTTVSVDWYTPKEVNFVNPTFPNKINRITKVISPAVNVTLKNIRTKEGTYTIDSHIRVARALNVIIENHIVEPGLVNQRALTAVRITDCRNVIYRNSFMRGHVHVSLWQTYGALIEDCIWIAQDTGVYGGDPNFLTTESKVWNLTVRNCHCTIPAGTTVGNLIPINGDSGPTSVENLTTVGNYQNLIFTPDGDLREAFSVKDLKIYNQNGFNARGLGAGLYHNLVLNRANGDQFFYIHSNTVIYDKKFNIANFGPIVWSSGIISEMWLYCTNWDAVSAFTLRDKATGGGFNKGTLGPLLVSNQWVKVSPVELDLIGIGFNSTDGDKEIVMGATGTQLPSDFLAIKVRVYTNSPTQFPIPS